MLHAIVTGATGFLGSALVNRLISMNSHVTAVVRPKSKNLGRLPVHRNIQIVEIELHQLNNLKELAPPADWFFHFAWDGIRGEARIDAELQSRNVEAAYMAARLAAGWKSKVFVGCGSQAEYGPQTGVIDELVNPVPDTAYGKAKLITYMKTCQEAKDNSVRFIWPRIFSLYGLGDYEGALLPYALRRMLDNLPVALTSGTQNWNFLHVEDAVEALILLAQNQRAEGVFNLASCDTRPLRSFLEEMKEIVGSESELCFGSVGGGEALTGFAPIIKRLEDTCSWRPQISFSVGITELCTKMRGSL